GGEALVQTLRRDREPGGCRHMAEIGQACLRLGKPAKDQGLRQDGSGPFHLPLHAPGLACQTIGGGGEEVLEVGTEGRYTKHWGGDPFFGEMACFTHTHHHPADASPLAYIDAYRATESAPLPRRNGVPLPEILDSI